MPLDLSKFTIKSKSPSDTEKVVRRDLIKGVVVCEETEDNIIWKVQVNKDTFIINVESIETYYKKCSIIYVLTDCTITTYKDFAVPKTSIIAMNEELGIYRPPRIGIYKKVFSPIKPGCLIEGVITYDKEFKLINVLGHEHFGRHKEAGRTNETVRTVVQPDEIPNTDLEFHQPTI